MLDKDQNDRDIELENNSEKNEEENRQACTYELSDVPNYDLWDGVCENPF